MRLLNARTRMFEEFYADIPDYAILSHTWEQEEVIHADMIALQKDPSSEVQRKIGFQKIEMTCQKALEDSMSYVWIDTCCIDKTSSAELSEAINSMFNWYQQAAVCYAYLADVPANMEAIPNNLTGEYALSDEEYERMLESTFGTSRWFTRGWTLQELIAPLEVRFYNKEFGFIGTKKNLAYALHLITGIDEMLLANEANLSAFCVARKMSWAAKRTTTRVEDIAYSLFGIFDVNLPLLYGEGMRAFQRLQEEVIRTCDDESIFAWEPNEPGFRFPWPRAILAPRPFDFAKCGKIVRWTLPSANQVPLPVRTKLNVRLPIVKSTKSGDVAMIGCRYEDNLIGLIGLRLEGKEDRLGTEKRKHILRPDRPYLAVVPIKEVKTSQLKSVTIAEIYESRTDAKQVLFRHNLKCWVSFGDNDHGFKIQQAHPSRHWNTETMVFVPPLTKRVSAGTHFSREDGIEFILTFGYPRDNEIHSQHGDEWVSLERPIEGRVNEQLSMVHSFSQHDQASSQLRLQGKHTVNNIEASMVYTKVMEEMIFLIKIRIREGRGVYRHQSDTQQNDFTNIIKSLSLRRD